MGTSERVAILEFMLSTGLVPRTVVNDSLIVVITEKYLNADFVLALSKVADISPEIALEAFQKAVCVGRAEVVKVLLSRYSYPLSLKEEALKRAARTGRHGIVEEMCVGRLVSKRNK
ncbi:hypothetical protein GN244_ATG14008 [Phytophthora infestans]|uniref:Uncharacterized protein n=1 Tax=Phytophthora infestans TaxID=4787 RepID=A0A833WQN1_PHYIN|nr:hypothetical protein GN244_ATG14008 [Phytophthora infestans]